MSAENRRTREALVASWNAAANGRAVTDTLVLNLASAAGMMLEQYPLARQAYEACRHDTPFWDRVREYILAVSIAEDDAWPVVPLRVVR
jgi:hypothetical protein